MEEAKILNITERYKLNSIYYNGEKKQIFKRVDRYSPKKYLIIIFLVLTLYNIIEIVYNILFLVIVLEVKFDENMNMKTIKIVLEICSIVNLVAIIALSALTFTKLKIDSLIFY